MILIYKIGERINKLSGIFSLFLYSISYLNVIYERRGWQLSFESLLILVIILSILEMIKNNQKYIFTLTLSIILLTQFEIGLFNLIPLVVLSFFLFHIRICKRYLLVSLAALILANSCLFMFDLRHNFLNSKYLLNYFSQNTKERVALNLPLAGNRLVYQAHNLIPNTLARTLFPSSISNLAIQYANCPEYLLFKQSQIPPWLNILVISLILYTLIYAWRNRKSHSDKTKIYLISALFFLIHFTAIAFYTYRFNGEMAEYYLIPTFVFFFIITANILATLSKTRLRILIFIFLMMFGYINISTLFNSKNPYGFREKIQAINFSLSIVKDNSFVLDSFQTCWYSGGYRYLYSLTGHEPLQSYMDQYLSEYYSPDNFSRPKFQVVILTPELIGSNPEGYNEYRNEVISRAYRSGQFGAIEVYIVKI
ncbi:hypothetical protein FJY90_02415 [Candidatus Gottesmanbacteria bacterium]|nr:hypothetical protein [Candidatus Gottesmanbacteria bacterium]